MIRIRIAATAMVKIVEMDETITLDKQLEENIGPVILINKINVDAREFTAI